MNSERLVVRPAGPLSGSVRVPGDKSISHRALILGAIAAGASQVEGFLPSADCAATLRAVKLLGIEVEHANQETLTIHGRGLHGLQEPARVVNCARSGTTMRLLAGLLAGQPFFSVLGGDRQLLNRPMDRVTEPLRRMGAAVCGRKDGRLPPLAISGGKLAGIDYSLPVASAQVKSALLLAGLYADGPTTLRIPGPARDHTERMLVAMGCDLQPAPEDIQAGPSTLRLIPGRRPAAIHVHVPGDISSAAFLLVAATLVEGSEITIRRVGLNPTRTGLTEVLRAMGARIVSSERTLQGGEPAADVTVCASLLQATEVGGHTIVRTIDELPVLAVAATQAEGETVILDAAELRVKETDRIATTVQELRKLGADIKARPDGFVVRGPRRLRGTAVDSHGDHRLAMALAIAGLVADGETVVRNTGCIADSFPGFDTVLTSLGAHVA